MEDNKQVNQPENDAWLDEILGTSENARELGPDELAVQAAGLTHPEDLVLEQILAENWDDVPDAAEEVPAASPAEPAPEPAPMEQTQLFTPVVQEPVPEEKPQKKPAKPQRQKKQKKAEPPTPVADGEKSRPAPKKGYGLLGLPHIVSTIIWLMLIIAIGISLGYTLWISTADLMAFGKPDLKVTVTITEEDTIQTISKKLGDAGLIEYPTLFEFFATLTGKDEDIDVGTFTLNATLDYNAMINNMINYGPAREEVEVLIPEGYTCAQIFALMEEKGICKASELEEYAANGELSDYWFLEGVKRGSKYCLEGYLFPDTYRFYTNDNPRHVLEKFLGGFDYRYTDLMKSKLEPLNQKIAQKLSDRGYGSDFISSHKITIREIVIIASMIEKETANRLESYTISSVIYNRLTNPGNFPYLNIDATLIYALGGNVDPATGEVKPLTNADLNMDHPYNTYKKTGLPPGPISNPGRNSLDAALTYDTSEGVFYYYVYNPQSGVHLFAETAAKHEANINYVNSLK